MTITASYNSLDEKVFSFGSYIDNKPVNNEKHTLIEKILVEFDDNQLAIYKGDSEGYFLVILHENEPVSILISCFKREEIDRYIKRCEKIAYKDFTFNSDILTMLIAIYYQYEGNAFLDASSLLLLTKNEQQFVELYQAYSSMYAKHDDFERETYNDRVCDHSKFVSKLNENELSIFTFTMISNLDDYNFHRSWRHSFLSEIDKDLADNCFEIFGISDAEVDGFWQSHKICIEYFIKQYRAKKQPSIYYCPSQDYCIESYLTEKDELSLFRSHFHKLVKENYDYVCDMNEPADRG